MTWEERKTQERINKWAKEERSKGGDIKIGRGKVKVNGVWKFWDDMEKENREKECDEGKKDRIKKRKQKISSKPRRNNK